LHVPSGLLRRLTPSDRRPARAPGSAGPVGPANRYLRQREYPQPPPPSRNNTTRMINRVSMLHHLLALTLGLTSGTPARNSPGRPRASRSWYAPAQ
jgi:hypothetical protein